MALKTDKPTETYQELKRQVQSTKDSASIDDLPPEQQAWLRST